MAYVINKTSGAQLIVLEDGTVDTSTSVGLVGRNYTGYGEIQNENFVGLLENWANNNPPARPLSGQTWFNTSNQTLNVYNGIEWAPVGSAVIDNNTPEGIEGTLWFKTSTSQLFVYNNDTWNLIGPEGAENFGATRIRSRQVLDNFSTQRIILEVLVDGITVGVISRNAFQLDDSTPIIGFSQIAAGFTMSSARSFKGSLEGNAETATKLATARLINGISFDGQNDIVITSNTTGTLTRGNYLTGSNFNGAASTTWAVDASPSNLIGKVVARDSSGSFEAGTITADLVGDVSGNVTASTGISTFNTLQANTIIGAVLTGNASSATKLNVAREINGVPFDGTQDITVPAAANTLTGSTLAGNIVNLGTLNNLNVGNNGIVVGDANQLEIKIEGGSVPLFRDNTGLGLFFEVSDVNAPGGQTGYSFVNSIVSLALGGPNAPSLIPDEDSYSNLGINTVRWDNVYANLFVGTATQAQYADLAENYLADDVYPPGTVLEFGGINEVTIASDETRRVAGIVSTKPAYLMNSELQGDYVVAVALQGRVPCKVRGKIHKGDMLISGGSGYARPTVDPKIGTIIGKALEDFDGVEGVIEVVVGRI